MTSPRQNRPQSKQTTDDGSQKRILIYVALLFLMILYLLFKPSAPPPADPAATAPIATSAAPASTAAAPATPGAPATTTDTPPTMAKIAEECGKQVPGVVGYPSAVQAAKEKFCGCVSDESLKANPVEGPDARDSGIRQCFSDLLHQSPPASATRNMPAAQKVTDADLAGIPADKMDLLKKYCNAQAYKKAMEFRVDFEVFLKLNANYVNTCILMQSKPPAAVE